MGLWNLRQGTELESPTMSKKKKKNRAISISDPALEPFFRDLVGVRVFFFF